MSTFDDMLHYLYHSLSIYGVNGGNDTLIINSTLLFSIYIILHHFSPKMIRVPQKYLSSYIRTRER